MRPISAEVNALLSACRLVVNDGCADEFRDMASRVTNWDSMLAGAQRHAVVPLLFHALDHAGPMVAPCPIRDEAREQFERNALRNLELASRLSDILRALDAAGVAAMPIKGPLLALSAYGDITLREFLDLDLVVREGDRDRALAVLRDASYRNALPIGSGSRAALLAADYHLQLVHDAHGVVVELHWALGRGYFRGYLDSSWAWHNAHTISVFGRPVHTLSPEALLVYLCVHGAKHMWSQLNWICDVAALLHAEPRIDGSHVFALARATGTWRMVRLGLVIAADLLSAKPPADLPPGWDNDATTINLATRVRQLLCEPGTSSSAGDALAFQLGIRDRRLDRLSLWAHLVISPRVADVTAVSFPPKLRSLYHVLRPLRLLSKQSRAWVGRAEAKWRS